MKSVFLALALALSLAPAPRPSLPRRRRPLAKWASTRSSTTRCRWTWS